MSYCCHAMSRQPRPSPQFARSGANANCSKDRTMFPENYWIASPLLEDRCLRVSRGAATGINPTPPEITAWRSSGCLFPQRRVNLTRCFGQSRYQYRLPVCPFIYRYPFDLSRSHVSGPVRRFLIIDPPPMGKGWNPPRSILH